jgi:hypothetical protein
MPVDLKDKVYCALFDAISVAVTNYNTDIGTGNFPVVNAVLDNRAAGRQQAKAVAGPAGYPLIRLVHTGGNAPRTPTMTFALAAGLPNTDAVQKRILTLEMSITWDQGTIADADMTPLVSYIDSQFASLYPKLGLCYGKDFTWRDTQKDEVVDGVSRHVLRRAITVELWPHTSDLI